jgi:hypothetical protein
MFLVILFLIASTNSFSDKICLNHTFMIGLTWDMKVVHGTSRQCQSQNDCLKQLCIINDTPNVSWIAVGVTANK